MSRFADLWEPDSLAGLLLSTASMVVLAALYWLFGIATTGTTLAEVTPAQYAGGVALGSVVGGGILSIHLWPEWRDRWRRSVRLRLLVVLPAVVGIGYMVDAAPVVTSLGFVFACSIFVVGRTYLYLNA